MDSWIIRKATREDFPDVQKLDEGLFYNELQWDKLINLRWPYQYDGENFLRRMLTSNDSVCFVAEADRQLVGFLTGSLLAIDTTRPIQRSQLINLFVDAKWRDQGVGKALKQTFFQWSREKGAKKVLVMAYAVNEKAVAFYKREGFNPRHLTLEADLAESRF